MYSCERMAMMSASIVPQSATSQLNDNLWQERGRISMVIWTGICSHRMLNIKELYVCERMKVSARIVTESAKWQLNG